MSSNEGPDRLRAEDLVKTYSGRRVVESVSLAVERGQIVGLLGPNGAGKTTTFYLVVGLVSPDSGRVWLGDREITELPMYRRARLGVSYLPQEPSVFRKMTAEENLLAILETLDLSRSESLERCDELLETLRAREGAPDSRLFAVGRGETPARDRAIARALAVVRPAR